MLRRKRDITMSPQPLSSKTIEDIALKYGIEYIVYFGSYRTPYYNEESDIDIAFLTQTQLTADQNADLLEELIIYHRKSEIDLVNLLTAEPLLRYEVACGGRLLYEKETGIFERYAQFYIKRFYELKPVFEEEKRNIGKAIREVVENARKYSDLQ